MKSSFLETMIKAMQWQPGSNRSGALVGTNWVVPQRGLHKQVTGRAGTHARHVRAVKKAQRRRAFYRSLRRRK